MAIPKITGSMFGRPWKIKAAQSNSQSAVYNANMKPYFPKYEVSQNNSTPGKIYCKHGDTLFHNSSVFLKHKH